MIRTTLLLSLLFFASCNEHTHRNDEPPYHFQEISHGIYATESTSREASTESPSGFQRFSSGVNLIKTCNVITAIKGKEFGIQYTIESNRDTTLLVKKVWEFPDTITNNNGEKFSRLERKMYVSTNQQLFTFYSLDEDYEVIKGKWILKFFLQDHLLYQRTFILK